MLTEAERREITLELEHCEEKCAACVEALKVVQRHRGWVTDEGIRDVADFLEMSTDELDGVATFYPFIFRRPVGRHVILVCDGISCWIMGYEGIRTHLMETLGVAIGETTADGRFTLLPVSCIGACDRAPAMIIDNELHVDLTEEKIEAILEKYS